MILKHDKHNYMNNLEIRFISAITISILSFSCKGFHLVTDLNGPSIKNA